MSKYIDFQDLLDNSWAIISINSGDILGWIKVIDTIHQFVPAPVTVFSRGCLLDILNEFFDVCNEEPSVNFLTETPKPRTLVWRLMVKGSKIGEIKYYANWRQYCLFTNEEPINCENLTSICNFLEIHKKDRVTLSSSPRCSKCGSEDTHRGLYDFSMSLNDHDWGRIYSRGRTVWKCNSCGHEDTDSTVINCPSEFRIKGK
jgi:hypothetical protein